MNTTIAGEEGRICWLKTANLGTKNYTLLVILLNWKKKKIKISMQKNQTRIDFGIMFLKNVVVYEIYSKQLQWPNTFCTSLYIYIYVSMVWVQIPSREEQKFDSSKI